MKENTLLILFLAFSINVLAQTDPIYSFFTAGHTYGNPNNTHYGLHYPFVDFIPVLNEYPNMDLGILTGDIVPWSTSAYWDSAIVDIQQFTIPIHIAAGNHDISVEFESRFDQYYYSFKNKNDLFIILAPGLNAWNITGDQLIFLEQTLENNYTTVNNIFIFMHELIWWSPTNIYKDVKINYEPHYPGSTNFDTIVKPLLLNYPNNITIYAGDLGATSVVTPCMYDQFDNITLIGSGMGNGKNDNIIITKVYDDCVHFELVALNGNDKNAIGKITDYSINPQKSTPNINDDIIIYPNPIKSNELNISNNGEQDYKLSITDIQGKTTFLTTTSLHCSSVETINVSKLNSGVYLLKLYNEQNFYTIKIIID